ncbi:MAG: alpha-ketoglutarate-dependent dioxygenase AlkB [Alphaproteobacteria bacterium]|jgi:alkylated DNA repair dioxygenase AlkB|nr:alpha-ketoglutarate-dependent dioxygenase AlkB [Alphaproteobacteria bacterium]MDP6515181.1 alpha-ketoglutarate-dependent dioxygenase AlkB [Alphaproteobacteria bacterium]
MTAAATNLLPGDGQAWLHEDAVPAAAAPVLLAGLMSACRLRQEHATIMGRRIPIPRLTAWHGAASYAYSGIHMEPDPWNPQLLEAKAIAEAVAGRRFDSVLLNLYRDGRDSVSWHADDEAALGQNPVIASLSLGATRRFQFKHRRDRSSRINIDLAGGTCLVMAGAIQHHWLHQVPKTRRPVGARLNLTFRTMRV